MARINGGAATKSTISAWMTWTICTGVPVETCMPGEPACSAPNSSPAATTPPGRPSPSRATVIASIP